MKNFLDGLSYFPKVLEAVIATERSLLNVPGATKKQLILGSITGLAQVGEQVPNTLVSLISRLIDLVVTMLNSAGVFDHKLPPVTPAR